MTIISHEEIADKLAHEVKSNGKSKSIKVRTLIGHFNYNKRTTDNSTKITELFAERNILLNPSIMKFDNTRQLKLDDRVYLLERSETNLERKKDNRKFEIYAYISDKWFDEVFSKQFRT